MGKAKGARITITLECVCQKPSADGKTKKCIFRYTTSKNRRNTPNRLVINKFCPCCNRHSQFKEIK